MKHGHNLYDLINDTKVQKDTITIKIEEHYPYYKKYNGDVIPMINKRAYDTIINKIDEDLIRKKKDIRNRKSLEKARGKFEREYGVE